MTPRRPPAGCAKQHSQRSNCIKMNCNPSPSFLWLVGIEGAGHHLMRDVLRVHLKKINVIDKGPHYPLLLQRWDAEQTALSRTAVKRSFATLFQAYASAGITTVYEDTSFPFGGVEVGYEDFASDGSHRGPLRCPDILDLVELLEGLAVLRILVIHRSPLLTVSSALRRGFSNKIQYECRLAEAVHLHITRQLSCLPPTLYRTLCFEDFVQRPEIYVNPLADWWMIPLDDVRSGISAIRAAGTLHDIPPGIHGILNEFFTDLRIEQWQAAYRNNPLVDL